MQMVNQIRSQTTQFPFQLEQYVILLHDIYFFFIIHFRRSTRCCGVHKIRRTHDLFIWFVIEHKCSYGLWQNNFIVMSFDIRQIASTQTNAIDRYEINLMKRIAISS